MSRARLARYSLWHLRDYMRDKGPATLITIVLLGYLNLVSLNRARALGVAGPMLDSVMDQAFVSSVAALVILGVLFATNGIVADDRRHQYYRLIFAKPVTVELYYAHKFAVYGGGFIVVSAVLLTVYNLAVERFFPPLLLPVLGLAYVALGGIGFLLSAAWRFDWLSLATVLFGSRILWELFGDEGSVRGRLVHLLPPVHILDGIYTAVRAGTTLPAQDLGWAVAYGAGCFALGIVVLRRRSLGGR